MGELGSDRIARYLEKTSPGSEAATLDELFQRMANGETLFDVCKAWDVPSGRVLVWLMADEKRHGLYLRALEAAAHGLVAEVVAIADADPGVRGSEKTGYGVDAGAVAHAKLRIDTRMRVAAAHAKAMYGGEKGVGGGITVVVNRGVKSPAAAESTSRDDRADGTDPPPPVAIDGGIFEGEAVGEVVRDDDQADRQAGGLPAGIRVSADGRTLTVDA